MNMDNTLWMIQMNKYGTLTEFPMGIVKKARKLNIQDTRGTRNFGSLTLTSSVAKNGGNMNQKEKPLILKKEWEVVEPLVLTKEMEVNDE